MNYRTNSNNPNNPLKFEVRRVQQQTDGRSLSVVLPAQYTRRMNVSKGDLLKMYLDDRRLISEKVELGSSVGGLQQQ